MKEQKEKVIEANENFYAAVKTGDIDKLGAIWLQDENVKCVHPGWPMLHGWEAVSQSWKNIFENGGPLDIELQDVAVDVSGDTAWVICIEKIGYKLDDEVQFGFAQSTNIFNFDGSKWFLVLHHASPIPAPRQDVSSNNPLQ